MLRIPPSSYRKSAFSVLHLLFMASPEKQLNKTIETGGKRRKKYHIAPMDVSFSPQERLCAGKYPASQLNGLSN